MITAKELCEAMSECGLKYRSYSGRGMYGKECVGFTTGYGLSNRVELAFGYELSDCVELALTLKVTFDDDTIIKLFRHARTDSMGQSTIIYFPRVEWDTSISEPDEDGE
jgi:hypothetical protein